MPNLSATSGPTEDASPDHLLSSIQSIDLSLKRNAALSTLYGEKERLDTLKNLLFAWWIV
jgi:hypothetical protein